MKIKLKLKSVSYSGKSVGEDIRIEIELLGKKLEFGEGIRIRKSTTCEFNQSVGVFDIEGSTELRIKIKEKDKLFSDEGEIKTNLLIDRSKPFPQSFAYEVKVRERTLVFWKKTAFFTIIIDTIPSEYKSARVALYSDINPTLDSANLRSNSNDKSQILAAIPNYSNIILLDIGKQGNTPSGLLSDLWHKVSYLGAIGYIHSSLVEIDGQERDKIIEAIKNKAKEIGVDENLALNLSHCESKWLPFAHSSTYNKGIFQLGASTVADINDKYGGNIRDPWDPYQNIDGGLRYFKNLLDKYSGSSNALIRALVAWNAGTATVPVKGAFNLKNYIRDVQIFVHCILEEKRGQKVLKILTLALIIGLGSFFFFTSDTFDEWHHDRITAKQEITYLRSTSEDKNFIPYLQIDFVGDKKLERISFVFNSPEPFVYETFILNGYQKIVIDGSLLEAFAEDLTGDGTKEIIVQTQVGHGGETNIFTYKDASLEKIQTGDYPLFTSKKILFEDLNDDGIKEIIMPTRSYSDELIELTYYYRWNGREYFLYDHKDIVYSPSNG